MDAETVAAERSNLVESMAEAILYAWMHTDRSTIMPDRSAADYALGSQEWTDFWQSLGIDRRNVYRAQAEAALRASELLEKVETLEKRIAGAKESLYIPYPSSHASISTAIGAAKRYLSGRFDDGVTQD
jgi:hypothetical protein